MSNPEPTAPEPVADWIIVLSRDGDQWCALIGEDLQVGTAGFGPTIPEAIAALTQEMTVGGAWVGSPLYLGASLSAPTLEAKRDRAVVRLLRKAFRDGIKHAGKNVQVQVSDLLNLLDTFERGEFDDKLDESADSVTPDMSTPHLTA